MVFCCIWNRFVPPSQSDTIIVPPEGSTFINGLAQAYAEDGYDAEKLKGYLTVREYDKVLEDINGELITYMPCPICWCVGILLTIPTFGLILVLQWFCCV